MFLIAKQICRELRKRSTPAENLFWEKVRNKKFKGKKFCRQYPIYYDCNGRETFIVADFFCFEYKLIIELDGPIHDYRISFDKSRTKMLEENGYKVVRFKNREVEEEMDNVLLQLEELVK